MGRNRAFDTAAVVADCAALFRRSGYEGTSIDDLVRATGLQRGSLYGAFGSKRGIFLAALTSETARDPDATEPAASTLDLLLVALLELAPRDAEVRELCARRVEALAGDGVRTLGERILDRAQIALERKGTTP